MQKRQPINSGTASLSGTLTTDLDTHCRNNRARGVGAGVWGVEHNSYNKSNYHV